MLTVLLSFIKGKSLFDGKQVLNNMAEVFDSLLEFFSLKEGKAGTGMGLYLC